MKKGTIYENHFGQHRINFIAGFLPTCESPLGLSWSVIIYYLYCLTNATKLIPHRWQQAEQK